MTSLTRSKKSPQVPAEYAGALADISALLEQARRTASRAVNTVMTATYWEIGRRILMEEQAGNRRAEYGEELIRHLAAKLTERFGRGFGHANLANLRKFYTLWPAQEKIFQTPSEKSWARRNTRRCLVSRGRNRRVSFPPGRITFASSMGPE